eukprot:COSAG02_NODE_71083_length_192_cov_71.967742_1_plen_33_part_01
MNVKTPTNLGRPRTKKVAHKPGGQVLTARSEEK